MHKQKTQLSHPLNKSGRLHKSIKSARNGRNFGDKNPTCLKTKDRKLSKPVTCQTPVKLQWPLVVRKQASHATTLSCKGTTHHTLLFFLQPLSANNVDTKPAFQQATEPHSQ
ncbi:hypothetical protein BaRGS_00028058 [Batillaria attramentaria]|uniref:Uncharacterized protein n=1 Tax=Batillaria attramentaria TaxID=370345 RepID=A0ABD0K107_9CAEN